jgi:DNA mismatch endonuclease (patch repair protein)
MFTYGLMHKCGGQSHAGTVMSLPRFNPPSDQRSRIMSAIKSKGNKSTEARMAALLRRERLSGWRRGSKLPGRPDFLFRKERVALFVDGCFWHGCPRCHRSPKTNPAYWTEKISRNVARDARVSRKLRRLGFAVVRVRECQLRDFPDSAVNKVRRALGRPLAAQSTGKDDLRSLN